MNDGPVHEAMRVLTLCVTLAAALAACNGASDTQQPASGESVPEVGQVPDKTLAMTRISTSEQLAWSINELAARLGVDTANVQVSGVRPVQWRSGAIGCPEPGMSYTQALVDGLWITLAVGDAEYRYHAKTGGKPFFCPTERAEPPASGSGAD